ncbi:MAG: hypothetical protein JKP95_02640 [Oceanicaulis sp.]|nr:hypothetical protein [Oceanicaulis sp.]
MPGWPDRARRLALEAMARCGVEYVPHRVEDLSMGLVHFGQRKVAPWTFWWRRPGSAPMCPMDWRRPRKVCRSTRIYPGPGIPRCSQQAIALAWWTIPGPSWAFSEWCARADPGSEPDQRRDGASGAPALHAAVKMAVDTGCGRRDGVGALWRSGVFRQAGVAPKRWLDSRFLQRYRVEH